VLGALSDNDADVRAEAATLLGKLHDPDWAAPQLEPLLHDSVEQVRKNAALSLMKLRAIASIPALHKRLQQENHTDVQSVLALAISQLNSQDA
jgi:bilin biosynthesis protein